MSQGPTPASYVAKAERALGGARILLENDDSEGACNRAYYAMFDAAHAAPLAVVPDLPQTSIKTHRGLIAAFGKHLVQDGPMAATLGASLNKVERLRLLADYTGDPVSLADAAWAVTQAETFINAIKSSLFAE
jgi:uncharacterized protein (UPF0332 family)